MSTPFAAAEVLRPNGIPEILLVADHASAHIPPEYQNLGLPQSELERHIAYDIGVRGVVHALSNILQAPAVLSTFSRLLIDPNRGEDDPTALMKLSDGAIIPGNRYADAAELEQRLSRFYRPYHAAITAQITRAKTLGVSPIILSIHSFTPSMQLGKRRPWHIGVLWRKDSRLSSPLLVKLRTEADLCVGENQPYPGGYDGDCMDQHCIQTGLRHALIELRQDLITTEAQQSYWAQRFADSFLKVIAQIQK